MAYTSDTNYRKLIEVCGRVVGEKKVWEAVNLDWSLWKLDVETIF